jgi:phage shock protein PspC (stress-responsive transcriptional regulator)
VVWSLFWTVVVCAAIGFVFYLILRLISPRSADKVEDMIKGKKKSA